MSLLVVCDSEADFQQTQAMQKNNRLLTSKMLNGLTELKQSDPELVNGLIGAAFRKDKAAIIRLLTNKFNPFKRK